MDHLKNELGRFSPREAVLSDGAWSLEGLPQFLRERLDCRCENGGEARFRYEAALPLVQKQFRTGLDSLPPEDQACVQMCIRDRCYAGWSIDDNCFCPCE